MKYPRGHLDEVKLQTPEVDDIRKCICNAKRYNIDKRDFLRLL